MNITIIILNNIKETMLNKLREKLIRVEVILFFLNDSFNAWTELFRRLMAI